MKEGWRISNIVIHKDYGMTVDLDILFKVISKDETFSDLMNVKNNLLPPVEQIKKFSRVIIRLQDDEGYGSGTINIFRTGKVTIVGLRSIEEANEAIKITNLIMKRKRKK